MADTSVDIHLALRLIKKDLALDKDTLPGPASSSEELKDQLVPVISNLLNNDMERLLLALYRIDLDEQKVRTVLILEQPDKISETLADMIIDREMQKVFTRRKYAGSSSCHDL